MIINDKGLHKLFHRCFNKKLCLMGNNVNIKIEGKRKCLKINIHVISVYTVTPNLHQELKRSVASRRFSRVCLKASIYSKWVNYETIHSFIPTYLSQIMFDVTEMRLHTVDNYSYSPSKPKVVEPHASRSLHCSCKMAVGVVALSKFNNSTSRVTSCHPWCNIL